MILIANSGVLENVIFLSNGWKPDLAFFCLDMNKTCETRKRRVVLLSETGVILASCGEVGGHVILIVLLTIVRKLVSLSVRLFCLFLCFLLNVFDGYMSITISGNRKHAASTSKRCQKSHFVC